jgi:hypothetical protein
MLFSRAWPPVGLLGEFDDYQREEHLPQLMEAPGARQALLYQTLVDDLPAVYQGSGSRLVEYRCASLEDLFLWLSSDQLAAAVDDGGARWFGRMNELDGALYTGNLYEVRRAVASPKDPIPDKSAILAERFETATHHDAFDRWVIDEHLPALAAGPAVIGLRYCVAIRGRSPIEYYESPGDRAILVALDPDVPPVEAVTAPALLAATQDSLRWDVKLQYVRREVYGFICTHHAGKEPRS